jgi:hypothetical protein
MRSLIAAAVASALIAPGAHAEVSSWCLWTQLQDLHAVEVRCAGPIPTDVQGRYDGLRKAIEAAILRDASLRAGESAESAKAEMEGYRTRAIDPARCQTDPKLKSAVMYFGVMTAPETIAKLEAGLAVRRDPYEGDCL